MFLIKLERNIDLIEKIMKIWLCYVGTLSFSYDIECVLDALCLLKENLFSCVVKFVVIGDGPLKNRFEKYAENKICLCRFTGKMSYEKMVGLLCSL